MNAVLAGEFSPRSDPEEWKEHIAAGAASPCEVDIPIEKIGPYFVADLDKSVSEREPYLVDDGDFWRLVHKIVAVGRGPTRTYYVFESHDALQSWIYHMNAGKWVLVPAE